MKVAKLLYACILGSLLMYACKKGTEEQQHVTSGTDIRFAIMASMNNFAEMDLGQLASDSAEAEPITAFGAQMVTDHSMANTELKQLTGDLNLHAPDSLDATHAALKQQLLTLTGRSFDSLYIHSQVNDHIQAIELFEDQAQSGRQRSLREYAKEKLPVLQMHLQEAMTLAEAY